MKVTTMDSDYFSSFMVEFFLKTHPKSGIYPFNRPEYNWARLYVHIVTQNVGLDLSKSFQ